MFNKLLFDKYPNPTLQNYKTFTNLSGDVKHKLEEKSIYLKEKESNPVITQEQFCFIIKYLKDKNSKSLKDKQSRVIIKLFLLYGFDNDRISKFKIEDYNKEKRTLTVNCEKDKDDKIRERKVILELPYSLSKEIDCCIKERESNTKLNSNLLFVTNKNNNIPNGYLSDFLEKMKNEFEKVSSITMDVNSFTPTGMQKYGILQMILEGMNQSIIMELSGQDLSIFDYCQCEANRIKGLNRNRYINSNIRSIKTFDEI